MRCRSLGRHRLALALHSEFVEPGPHRNTWCANRALHAKLAAVQPGTEMTEPHRNHNAEGNVKDYACG